MFFMKYVYIVLTRTGTILSKLIKAYTNAEFTHVSIALDEDLKEMYSFGRLNPYNPFIGGFVHEYIDSGTFKRFSNTVTRIYRLPITDEQYNLIKNNIDYFQVHKEEYNFDIIGLFLNALHIDLHREKKLYCASFVKTIIDNAELEIILPTPIKPEDFKQLECLNDTLIIYEGLLSNYTNNLVA